jgi:acyl-CoA synthetase (AMP-forming)/AMP-acid ligase II
VRRINTACAQQSITFATAYDSLGEEGLRHSINEPEAYGIFTQASLLGTLGTVLADTPSIKLIVYDGRAEDVPSGALDQLKAVRGGSDDRQLQIYTFDEFVELGKQHPAERHLPQPDDVACIMYTSGSTGAPKGVQITNGNIVACIGAVQKLIGHIVCRGETYIAYLVRGFHASGRGSCPVARRLTFLYPPLTAPRAHHGVCRRAVLHVGRCPYGFRKRCVRFLLPLDLIPKTAQTDREIRSVASHSQDPDGRLGPQLPR